MFCYANKRDAMKLARALDEAYPSQKTSVMLEYSSGGRGQHRLWRVQRDDIRRDAFIAVHVAVLG